MTTTVDLCNAALAKIGAPPIATLDDESEPARLCKRRIDAVRDAVLRAHPWNCATARARLTADLAAPPFGFAHKFLPPADCLRVAAVEGGVAFRVEGGRILADAESLDVVYVRRPADPAVFDALLRETIAARLAAELAYPLVNSSALAESLWRLYELRLREARGIDAQEDGEPVAPASSWIAARA
ncbi:MAG: hypothetical protein IPK81_15840 [Rhodospirillales bacterium]|nr:MAG: hypothetical protein IPK81_15840 [Rhodospirillales bacterium]